MKTEFLVLAELGEKLEGPRKRSLIVSFVSEFLINVSASEVEPATYMILGRPFPKADARTLDVSWATLRAVINRLTNVDWRTFTEAFGKTGDLGATIESIFEESKIRLTLPNMGNI